MMKIRVIRVVDNKNVGEFDIPRTTALRTFAAQYPGCIVEILGVRVKETERVD